MDDGNGAVVGIEEWDAEFLNQVIEFEEQTCSSLNPTQPPPPFRPPPPPPPPPPQSAYFSHSPPRELSQRSTIVSAHSFNRATHTLPTHILSSGSRSGGFSSVPHNVELKQLEIDHLKHELGRVSKQLADLEQECSDLRKERDKNEEKLRSAFSRIEYRDGDAVDMKITNLKDGVHIQEHSIVGHGRGNMNSLNDCVGFQINAGASNCKEVGVQTEKLTESNDLMIKNNSSSTHHCSRKLLAIWDPPSNQHPIRNLVPKLLVACETEFQVLFGFLRSNASSITTKESLTYESSLDVALNHPMQLHSIEAAKVSHFYCMLTKIDYDMVKLKDLIGALADLCGLDNVMIVHNSLRVLRVLLNHVFRMHEKSNKRDNVMVEEPSVNNAADANGSRCSEVGSVFYENANETSNAGHMPFEMEFVNAESVCKEDVLNDGCLLSVSNAECISLFELLHQIVVRHKKEHVRLEGVSIMNMILMGTNAYVERERFGQLLVFQSVSQLLRNESGILVQMQAVHLLYLLLNCPKLMFEFCSGCKDVGMIAQGVAIGDARSPAFEVFCAVLDGLADCLSCKGSSVHAISELKLQRNAIIMLAFLASSGRCGFEIVLDRTNLFTLILQILASETDLKASESIQPSDVFKERTLLVREMLIFLNRLVSNPQYSAPVLRVLKNSRVAASLSIDIANRLSRKSKWLWQSDTMARQIRESEIVDLAGVFKKRVFTFLRDAYTEKYNEVDKQP